MDEPKTEFQRRELSYYDRCTSEFVDDISCRYVCALEDCRPWGISHVSSGYFHVHTFPFGMSCVALFPQKRDAEGYHRSVSMGDQWEVRQWEGRDDD